MNIVAKLLEIARGREYTALYGTPYQINDFLNDTDLSKSKNGTVVYMYLITGMSMVNGRYRMEVGIFFARMCDFDFNPEATLPVIEELKEEAAALFRCVNEGNEIRTVGNVRYQFGYDDFAENVLWCCARVTIEECAAVCVQFGEQCMPIIHDPTVATLPASDITEDGAVLHGIIYNPDGVEITGKGFYVREIGGEWEQKTVHGDLFELVLVGLSESTEYEYKAYIQLKGKEKEGDVESFETAEHVVIPPTVDSLTVSDITENGAKITAVIFNPDGVPISMQGVRYRNGGGAWVEVFGYLEEGVVLSELEDGTYYEVHGFVEYDGGSVYSEVVTFQTEKHGEISVETLPATNIKVKSFTTNARIVNRGETQVLTRCADSTMKGYDASNAEFVQDYYLECFNYTNCSTQDTDDFSVLCPGLPGETYLAVPYITAVIDGEEKEIKGDAVEVTTLAKTPPYSIVVNTLEPEIGGVVKLKGRCTPSYFYIQNGFFLKKAGNEVFTVLGKKEDGKTNFDYETELEAGEYIVQAFSILTISPGYLIRGEMIEFTV